MNVFHRITVQTLKKNRTRTLVTVIGIILSAAMITAVAAMAGSVLQNAMETTVYQDGSWHGNVLGEPLSTVSEIQKKGQIAASEALQQLGYSPLKDSKNDAKPYLYVLGTEKNPTDILPIHITSGRYPQNSGEIILPNHLAVNGGIAHAVGDTLELKLGQRLLDGERLIQMNPFMCAYKNGNQEQAGEVFELRETRSYTVVGFFDRISYSIEDYSAPGYTAFTVMDDPRPDDYLYDLYFQMKDPNALFPFMDACGIQGNQNHELLMYQGVFKYNNFRSTLLHLSEIVIALIVFGSVALIYNAFSISMSERTKQFGLLSSVGATKRQLSGMIRWEAWILSLTGIPIGVLAGIGGIGITLYFIGDKFKTLGMPVPMRLHVAPAGIAAAVLVSFATVFLSAWLPSRRLRKLSAIQAIHQNQDIAVKGKKLRTGRLTQKLFGLPGTLAQKYYKRSRKKYRATVISLFMSIVLFISAFSFTQYMEKSIAMGFGDNDCDLTLFLNESDRPSELSVKEVLALVKSEKTVTDAAFVIGHSRKVKIPAADLHDSAASELQPGEEKAEFVVTFVFADDAAYDAYLRQQHLDPDAFRDSQSGVLLGGTPAFNSDSQKYESLTLLKNESAAVESEYIKRIPGCYEGSVYLDENGRETVLYQKKDEEEQITLPAEEAVCRQNLIIGAVTKNRPYFVSEGPAFVILYPESLREQLTPDWQAWEQAADFMIRSSDHRRTADALKGILASAGIAAGNLTDVAEIKESDRNVITIIRVFSTGFIVLISLIAAANVFNTITTNIGLRKRDFAMLRSVGMTEKQLQRMLNYECILYGSKSLLYGLPVSALISVLIWKSVSSSFQLAYQGPWPAIGISVCSVFLVVFVTMLYAMSRIRKDNILEDLRSENF